MRILVAPQEFKGTLTAREAAEVMAQALREELPDAELDVLPIADGGPGTVDAVAAAVPEAREVRVPVEDPLGRAVSARFLMMPDGRTAVLEMAEAAGLWRVAPQERDPLNASTFGVGQMLRAALDAGAKRLILGLGGSATNDGGAGAVQALGLRFRDAAGHVRTPAGGIAHGRESVDVLREVADVDLSGRDSRLLDAELLLATDVTSPLLGPTGASRMFGPQKGTSVEAVEVLEDALARFAGTAAAVGGHDVAAVQGAGAAGGLAFGLAALFGGRIVSGFDVVAEVSGLDARLDGVDWVLTGEGRFDQQSLLGKGPVALANRARGRGCRVVAFVGAAHVATATTFHALVEAPASPPLCLHTAREALDAGVRRWARQL